MVSPDVVFAYIDAGSAGFMVQLVIGAAAGSALSIAIFWRRLTGRVSSFIFRKNKGIDDSQILLDEQQEQS